MPRAQGDHGSPPRGKHGAYMPPAKADPRVLPATLYEASAHLPARHICVPLVVSVAPVAL